MEPIKPNKRIRKNIYDLKNNYPEEFGRFVMALDAMIMSDDWERICGIHGLSFNPFDKSILCATDPTIVSSITGIGEPQYCPHGVKHFLIWHTIYLMEFEFILNRYNQSKISNEFISLPWLDISNIKTNDYSFMTDKNITILFDSSTITIPNPLVGGRIFRNGIMQKTTRNGYLNPKTKSQRNQMTTTQTQLENSLLITNYESLSSTNIPKNRKTIVNTIPLETPHNTIHTSVGGSGGSMSTVSTAAHDPLFWLHHCNVDRYFYNWMLRVTKNFTNKLSPNEILPETLKLWLTPFHTGQINLLAEDNFRDYKFCWTNNTRSYLKISDVIDLYQFNFAYELIEIKQKLTFRPQYFDLISIPIPRESLNIKLFIVPNKIDWNIIMDEEQKELYLAGMACWIGINRTEIYCSRCEKTRTNLSIDISDYLMENHIGKKNISEFKLILEADGLGIVNFDGTFNKYNQQEILADGKYLLVLDSDDIIINREFKFESKYIHTRFVQGIIHKLERLGYSINDIGCWDEISNVVKKFETDWGLGLETLIKFRPLDKLKNKLENNNKLNDAYDTNDLGIQIMVLKNLIINGLRTSNKVKIYYMTEGFDSHYNEKILNCINDWVNIFKSQLVDLEFVYWKHNLIEQYIQKPNIKFSFVHIDGDYGVCGNTFQDSNTIYILIDSEENYLKLEGLFELIVCHELGHAFGLTHNPNPNSIMYPFVTDLNKKVGLSDVLNVIGL